MISLNDVIKSLNIRKNVTLLQVKNIYNVLKNVNTIDLVRLLENLFDNFSIDTIQSIKFFEFFTNKEEYETSVIKYRSEDGNCVYNDRSAESTVSLVVVSANDYKKLLILETKYSKGI